MNTTDPPQTEPLTGRKNYYYSPLVSTEFSTNSDQDRDPAQAKHTGDDGLDPEREAVSDGFIEPLVVKKDDEGGEDAEEVH